MQTTAWGPDGALGAWGFMACCALNYPENNPTDKQRLDAKTYLYSLMNILPCVHCRRSSLQFIKQLPPEPFLDDRAGFCVFLYLFKSLVNKKLEKPNCTFESFIEKYEKYRAKCARKQALGCTEPAKHKCPQEIEEWCADAWKRYSNYQERINEWYRRQALKQILAILAYVIIALFVGWLSYPRLRKFIK